LHYTRIYQSLINHSLKSDKKLYYTLSYLKLRAIASQRAGFFSFEEAKLTLNLSPKTTTNHIKRLISDKLVIAVEGGYLMQDERKVKAFNTFKTTRDFIVVEVSELMKYSWKNISYFRAYFSELRNEKDIRLIRKVATGFYVRPKGGGEKILIKNEELLYLIPFYSYLRTSKVNECSIATAVRYRKKQNVAKYTHKIQPLLKFKKEYLFEEHCPYTIQQSLMKAKVGHKIRNQDFVVTCFSPPSTRVSNLKSRTKSVSDYELSLLISENCLSNKSVDEKTANLRKLNS
jgi:hypothetical protein